MYGFANAAERAEIGNVKTNIIELEKIGTRADGELWQKFINAYDDRIARIVERRFGPLSTVSLSLMRNRDPQKVNESIQDRAANTLNRAAVYSARDMVADELTVWLENGQYAVVSFFANSIGQSDELEINPLDINPESTMVEESVFARFRKTHGISYGVRPFRSSPYAYVSARITYDSQPLARVLVRYHFNHFSEHEFEGVIAVPVGHMFSIHMGFSYELERTDALRAVVRVHAHMWGGEFFAGGASVGNAPFNGFVGYARAW